MPGRPHQLCQHAGRRAHSAAKIRDRHTRLQPRQQQNSASNRRTDPMQSAEPANRGFARGQQYLPVCDVSCTVGDPLHLTLRTSRHEVSTPWLGSENNLWKVSRKLTRVRPDCVPQSKGNHNSWCCANLVIERCQRQLVLVLSIDLINSRACLLQLRLGELDYGTEPQLIASLRQVKPHAGLREQFRGYCDPSVCRVCLQPRGANISYYLVAKIPRSFRI